MSAKFILLGCGPSTGVPLPSCPCPVCHSQEPKNKRMKASGLLVTEHGKNILVDTSTDFRHQALAANLQRLDAVLFTHHHADHILGLDDLRAFNFTQKTSLPCFARPETQANIREVFRYTFEPDPDHVGGQVASLEFQSLPEWGSARICGEDLQFFLLEHGHMKVSGFRYGDFAYATDCHAIPEQTRPYLEGLKTLVLGALRERPHPSHFSISEAVQLAHSLGIKRCILTHLSHEVDYVELSERLPAGVELAFDGLEIEVNFIEQGLKN